MYPYCGAPNAQSSPYAQSPPNFPGNAPGAPSTNDYLREILASQKRVERYARLRLNMQIACVVAFVVLIAVIGVCAVVFVTPLLRKLDAISSSISEFIANAGQLDFTGLRDAIGALGEGVEAIGRAFGR